VLSQTPSEIADLIRRGRIAEARQELGSLSSRSEETESILFLHGLLSADADSAAEFYETLLETYPDGRYGDIVLYRLAQMKYAQGLYRNALNQFSRLASEYPRSSLLQRTQYWMALCFHALGEKSSAAEMFRKAIDDHPQSELTRIARRDFEQLDLDSPDEEQADPEPQNRYTVQIGAFANQSNALLRKSYFERQGYSVQLSTKMREGRTLYLVWVGSYASREEAKQMGERLKKRFGVQYTLVMQ
jgi:tetratricopeptide (TPR) repeat protein